VLECPKPGTCRAGRVGTKRAVSEIGVIHRLLIAMNFETAISDGPDTSYVFERGYVDSSEVRKVF